MHNLKMMHRKEKLKKKKEMKECKATLLRMGKIT
jgi:hypothetical protein